MKLNVHLGDYPNTRALRSGALAPPSLELAFADIKVPNRGFKPMVRELKFDASELAIVTFLQARAYGKPIVLLPATLVGRAQHQCIVYDPQRGRLQAKDLEGRRVGARAYAQTTVTWVRGMLGEEQGLDSRKVRWVTFEDGHLAEYEDPPNCERAPEGKDMMAMLAAGEIDAAIVGNEGSDPRFRTLVPDPMAAHEAWCARHGAVPVNHLMTVRSSLSKEHPEAVRELFRLLVEAKKAAPPAPGRDMLPFGYEALKPSLEIAIEYAMSQDLMPRRVTVEELFDERTRSLAP